MAAMSYIEKKQERPEPPGGAGLFQGAGQATHCACISGGRAAELVSAEAQFLQL